MRRLWIATFTIITSLLAAGVAHAGCVMGKLVDLPVTMDRTRPILSGKINGRDVRFLLDTGAFFSMISPGVAVDNKLPREGAPSGFYLSGAGGDASAQFTSIKQFMLAGTMMKDVFFIVGGSEVATGGIIGQNILHLGDDEIDLKKGMVSILRPTNCGMATLAYWAKPDQPISMIPMIPNTSRLASPVGKILINGKSVTAMFDTGASTSTLSPAAANRLGIGPNTPGTVPAGFSGGIGSRTVEQWRAKIASITIGGEQLRNAELHVSSFSKDFEIDMLIGADFFLTHHVLIANSQNRIYFTYEGGSFFDVSGGQRRAVDAAGKDIALGQTAAPTDAEGFSRRGMAYAANRDWKPALADLDEAVRLSPGSANYFRQRSIVRARAGDEKIAIADMDKAVALNAGDAEILLDRAELRWTTNNKPGAYQDVAAADRLLGQAADDRLRIADFLTSLDAPDKAMPQYDLWLAMHPDDRKRPDALAGRCWARALLGRELEKALADCTAALRSPEARADRLDSRGLVNLRMGRFADAIRDYDTALALDAKIAWSFHGRGLAKIKSGQIAAGEADLAAAKKLNPEIEERARRFGIDR